MRRSTRNRESASSLSAAELSGLKELVATDPSEVEKMLSNKPEVCNVDTLTAELDHLCAMNKLSVAELLSRFFSLPMLSNYLVSVGKSGKGNAPTLSSRLASHWAAEGAKRPKMEKHAARGKEAVNEEKEQAKKVEDAWNQERAFAIAAVRMACVVTRAVQAEMVQGEGKVSAMDKADSSPVTIADFAAQALINMSLTEKFPDDAMISEEDSEGLQKNPSALASVVRHVGVVAKREVSSEEVLKAIAYGKGKTRSRTWVLDPIDGTKGFIRQAQYAVCLGLMQDGQVVVGCIGCPGIETAHGKGVLQIAVKGQGAYEGGLEQDAPLHPLRVSTTSVMAEAKLTESYESGHTSHSDSEQIATELGLTIPPLRIDSQAKYAVMARGDVSLYLRMPQKTRRENIWDHAAGVLIVKEAGGTVSDCDGRELDFSKGEKLSENQGIVLTNGPLHAGVLAAIKKVLGTLFYSQAIVITAAELNAHIEGGEKSVLFTAARDETGQRWCPDCRQADLVLEVSRVKPESKWLIVEVPREEWKVTPGQDHFLRKAPYNVTGVPTLAHFRDGKIQSGVLVEEQLFDWENVHAFLKR